MARKKKSSGLPPWLIALILVIGGVAAYFYFYQASGDASLRTATELNPDDYYQDANSLRGNTYKIDATIDLALGNSPTKGRLFSIDLNKAGDEGVKAILPVLVPTNLGNLTIQKGQHYLMKVKVVENGLLEVEEAYKP